MSDRIIVATMALAGCLMMAPPAEAALLGYWKFDEDSGTVANDSGPNGLDGTVVFGEGGGWETTDSKSGNSLRFTGRNENVVNLPSVFPDLGDADPFTISAWVKETRSEGTQTQMPVIFYQAPGDSFTPNVQILRDVSVYFPGTRGRMARGHADGWIVIGRESPQTHGGWLGGVMVAA